MLSDLPLPTRHCPACGAGHYAAVRFCPFCGAAQVTAPVQAVPSAPAAPPTPPVTVQSEPAPRQPVPRPVAAPSPAPQVAGKPPEQPSTPPPPRPVPRRRWRVRHAVLAAAAIAALAALARQGQAPAPATVPIGPAWTAVPLAPWRDTPLLRLTADAPFSLRIDGDRVMRVAPGSGAAVAPKALRGLELRSGRGRMTVTLTPRGG